MLRYGASTPAWRPGCGRRIPSRVRPTQRGTDGASQADRAGVAERLVVLENAGIDWRPWVAHPPAGAGDDVIDALVLTLTAADLALGREVPVFDDGPTTSGRPSRITG